MHASRSCLLAAAVLLVGLIECCSGQVVDAGSQVETSDPDMCGKTSLDDSSGVIQSPLFPESFAGSFTCNYVISVGRNNSISLDFIEFQMESYLRHCAEKWMTISCSVDGSQASIVNSIAKYCGVKRWASSLKADNCPFVLLQFGSNSDSGEIRYNINYTVSSRVTVITANVTTNESTANVTTNETTANVTTNETTGIPDMECGQTLFNATSGVIALPSNSNLTVAKINCTYTIAPGDVYEVGLNVSYLDLLTLTKSLEKCDQTSVQIMSMIDGTKSVYPVPCEGASSGFTQDPYFPFTAMISIALVSNSYDPRNKLQIPYYTNDIETRNDSRCGRTSFSDRTGIITSPHFPLPYPHNLSCSYRVTVDPDKIVAVRFLNFHLQAPSYYGNCAGDWLTINCLSNGTGVRTPTLNRKFCGTIKWSSALRFSNCSALLIGFFADGNVAGGGFQIQYSVVTKDNETVDGQAEVECANETIFNSSSGEIILPANSRRYLSKINCTYTISSPLLTTVQSRISINMSSINSSIIISSFPSCSYSYFKVECIDANAYNSIKYCQPVSRTWTETTILNNCRNVRIQLYSDFFDFREAYRLPFRVIATDTICGTLSHHDPTGVIASPSSSTSLSYSTIPTCTYSIFAGVGQTVSLTFSVFQVDYEDSYCYRERLTLSCRGSTGWNPFTDTQFCGRLQFPRVMRFFNCSTLDVIYFSYYSYYYHRHHYYSERRGFQLNYTVSQTNELEFASSMSDISCGTTNYPYTSTSTTLSLPYQYMYPVGRANCTYNIVGGSKSEIRFTAAQVNAVANQLNNCSRDFIQFTCLFNNGTSSNTFGPYCRSRPVPNVTNSTVFINCNSLQVTLRSLHFNRRARYLQFTRSVNECGNTSFTSPNGTITSPRFPSSYPLGANCLYTIALDENKTVTLNFSHFTISGSASTSFLQPYDYCYYDYLQIRCSKNGSFMAHPFLNRNLCGSRTLMPIVLSGCSNVTLNFVSNFYTSYQGFKLQYTVQDTHLMNFTEPNLCGQTSFAGRFGNLSSPGYPLALAKRLNCTYLITAGETRSVTLEFLTFRMEGSSSYQTQYHNPEYHYGEYRYRQVLVDSCAHTHLTISCVNQSARSNELYTNRRLCGFKVPFNTTLHDCDVVSLNFISDAYVVQGGFKVKYTSLSYTSDESECGRPTFSGPFGFVTSPGFPSEYPHGVDCTYSIAVPDDKFISLMFQTFSVTAFGRRCYSDWVEINCLYNGTIRQYPSDPYSGKRFCGNTAPFSGSYEFYGCSNLTINMVTDFTAASKGFIVAYALFSGEIPCGTTTYPYSSSSSTLYLPYQDQPQYQRGLINCTYAITANRATTTFDLSQLNLIAASLIDCKKEHFEITCVSNGGSSSSTFGPYCQYRRVQAGVNGNVFADCDSLLLTLRSPFYDPKTRRTVNFTRTAVTTTATTTTPTTTTTTTVPTTTTKASTTTKTTTATTTKPSTTTKTTTTTTTKPSTTTKTTTSSTVYSTAKTCPIGCSCNCLQATTSQVPSSMAPCPKECTKSDDGTFCKCPDTQTTQATVNNYVTKTVETNVAGQVSGQQSHVKGSVIGLCVAIVIVVIVIVLVLAFVWRRHPCARLAEDEEVLKMEDVEIEEEEDNDASDSSDCKKSKAFASRDQRSQKRLNDGLVPMKSMKTVDLNS